MGLINHYDDHNFKQRPDVDGDPIVSAAAVQTLTNKTLTAPVLSAPTGIEEVRDIPVSFETGEQLTVKVYFPYAVTINKIRSIVTKALAATDAGTITARNTAGSAMANGVLTHAASAALGNEQVASPTTNNTIAADTHMDLVVAKTTAGGKALVSIEFTRS